MKNSEFLSKYEQIVNEDESWFGHEEGYTYEDAFEHFQNLYERSIILLSEIVKDIEKGERQ